MARSSSGDCRRKSNGAARTASREGRPSSRPGCVANNLTLGYAIALVSALTRELSTEPLVKQLADRTILTRQRSSGPSQEVHETRSFPELKNQQLNPGPSVALYPSRGVVTKTMKHLPDSCGGAMP